MRLYVAMVVFACSLAVLSASAAAKAPPTGAWRCVGSFGGYGTGEARLTLKKDRTYVYTHSPDAYGRIEVSRGTYYFGKRAYAGPKKGLKYYTISFGGKKLTGITGDYGRWYYNNKHPHEYYIPYGYKPFYEMDLRNYYIGSLDTCYKAG